MVSVVSSILGSQAYNRTMGAEGMVDPSPLGQFGIIANPKRWAANKPAVTQHVIGRVLTSPRGFNDLPEPKYWHEAWKALIEKHARTVDGLDQTITTENVEMAFGRDGNMVEVASKTTMAKSSLSIGITDLEGYPMQHFVSGWIRMLVKNPQTGYPDVITLRQDARPTDFLLDYNAGSVLWYEPDPLFRYPVRAWLQVNARPNDTLPIKSRADNTGGAGELVEGDIPFTGIYFVSKGVYQLAKKLMQATPMYGISPIVAPSIIDDVAADIGSSFTGSNDDLLRAQNESLGY